MKRTRLCARQNGAAYREAIWWYASNELRERVAYCQSNLWISIKIWILILINVKLINIFWFKLLKFLYLSLHSMKIQHQYNPQYIQP